MLLGTGVLAYKAQALKPLCADKNSNRLPSVCCVQCEVCLTAVRYHCAGQCVLEVPCVWTDYCVCVKEFELEMLQLTGVLEEVM